jgi:hypothetical protein
VTGLTGLDRRAIAQAREVAALNTVSDFRQFTGENDGDMARTEVLVRAQLLLVQLARIAERQAGEDTRRLGAIRDLLGRFDWEHHDRQLALEAIERIVDGG